MRPTGAALWAVRLVSLAVIGASIALGVAALVSRERGGIRGVGEQFSISSRITAEPGCREPARLYPGVRRCLIYVITNPFRMPITVNSVKVIRAAGGSGCPAANLDLRQAEFHGAFEVPARGTAALPPARISLVETGTNQDVCSGATFTFDYRGKAKSAAGIVPQTSFSGWQLILAGILASAAAAALILTGRPPGRAGDQPEAAGAGAAGAEEDAG